MQENNDGNWPKVGIFVMNASLNKWISRVKGSLSPYKLYYGQIPWSGAVFSISEAARFALSEDGLLAAEQLLEACADAEEVANIEDTIGVIKAADAKFFEEIGEPIPGIMTEAAAASSQ